MVDIPLARGDWNRQVAKEARILLRNRYYEENPVLTETGVALISRPSLRRWLAVGEGPIRGIYSQPGSFSDALFVVSGEEWYRVDKDGTTTLLQGGIEGGGASVSMAGTGNIGETPEYMFMADGSILYVYIEDGYATGRLEGSPANGDVVRIGSIYYQFTSGSVDSGTPDGTSGNPWLVAVGISDLLSFGNLQGAINADGVAGTDYSTDTTANPDVQGFSVGNNNIIVRATTPGIIGNGIVTTETGAGIAWLAATLTGGGTPTVLQVPTPDDVGIISLGYIASYVVCVPAQGQGINGRFFWIEPGEITIDPLNFATAERAPDPISGVIVFGDQFWLPGQTTTEVWYFTGDIDAPVLRLKGVTFDRGTWEGTALQVKDSMIIVDSDGGVFQISGGETRISNPSIEERIRKAIAYQASVVLY